MAQPSNTRSTGMVQIHIDLLRRICDAVMDMQAQGAICNDINLMEDLDATLYLYYHERRHS